MYAREYHIKGYHIRLESEYGEQYLPKHAKMGDAGLDLCARVVAKKADSSAEFLPEWVYINGKLTQGTSLTEENLGELMRIPAGRTVAVPTGLKWKVTPSPSENGETGETLTMLVFARSGLAIRCGLGLANGVGVIDLHYPEEILVGLRNESEYDHYLRDGCRIAQAVLVQVLSLGGGEGQRTSGLGHTGV